MTRIPRTGTPDEKMTYRGVTLGRWGRGCWAAWHPSAGWMCTGERTKDNACAFVRWQLDS